MPNRVMSAPWNNGPSIGMRQDDVLRGELNKLNNKLFFNSDPQETKQLREQIAQLTTNQIPPDVSPDDIAALQDRKKEGYTVKKMSYGYKIQNLRRTSRTEEQRMLPMWYRVKRIQMLKPLYMHLMMVGGIFQTLCFYLNQSNRIH